jgi:hypothetical protein
MRTKSILAVVGSALCVSALFLTVPFMGSPIHGYSILFVSLGALGSVADLPFFLAAVATLLSIFCVSTFVKSSHSRFAFVIAIVGSICGIAIAFNGGHPNYLAIWLWMFGLVLSLASYGIKPNNSFKRTAAPKNE